MKMLENLEYCEECGGCGVLFSPSKPANHEKVPPSFSVPAMMERCDSCKKFKNDDEALAAVEELTRGAFANHRRAIQMDEHSKSEEVRLRNGIKQVLRHLHRWSDAQYAEELLAKLLTPKVEVKPLPGTIVEKIDDCQAGGLGMSLEEAEQRYFPKHTTVKMKMHELIRWEAWKLLRSEVRQFAFQMESTLAKNDHKGPKGWKNCSVEYLLKRLYEEVKEVAQACDVIGEPPRRAGQEAIDVANFAMFIWDVTRPETAGDQELHSSAGAILRSETSKMTADEMCQRLGVSMQAAEAIAKCTPPYQEKIKELLHTGRSVGKSTDVGREVLLRGPHGFVDVAKDSFRHDMTNIPVQGFAADMANIHDNIKSLEAEETSIAKEAEELTEAICRGMQVPREFLNFPSYVEPSAPEMPGFKEHFQARSRMGAENGNPWPDWVSFEVSFAYEAGRKSVIGEDDGEEP